MNDHKLSSFFLNRVRVLQSNLEELLERQPTKTEKSQPFEASSDLENFSIILSEDQNLSTREKIIIIFSQLGPYFENGILFQDVDQEIRAIAAFDKGIFFPLSGLELKVGFSFPNMNLVEVRKLVSKEIFSELKSLNIISDEKTDTLIFSPEKGYIFLVTSNLAPPWLKTHIEKIQIEILKKLGDGG